MRNFLLRFLTLCLLASAGCQSPPAGRPDAPPNVWVDTDFSLGIDDKDADDAIALAQLFHSPEVRLAGISTVFGHTDVSSATRTVAQFVDRFGPGGLEIAAGADRVSFDETPATRALYRALLKSKLTLLALGPLTNVAALIRRYPEVIPNLERVIIVAGRRPGHEFRIGDAGASSPRDFNFELDPAAVQWLLDSEVELTFVPFEGASQIWLEKEDIARLRGGDAVSVYLAAPLERWRQYWHRTFAVSGFNPFEALAVEYLVRPDLLGCERKSVRVATEASESAGEGLERAEVRPYLIATSPGKKKKSRSVLYCAIPGVSVKEDILRRVAGNATPSTGITH